MLQKTFGIYANDLEDCSLYIEAGKQHIACWCKDTATGILKAFEFFQFDSNEEKEVNDILHDVRMSSKIMDIGLNVVSVIWNDEDCICVPSELYNEELAPGYLDVMLGDAEGVVILAEPLEKHTLLSRCNIAYKETFTNNFPQASFTHKFFDALKKDMAAGSHELNEIKVIFYPSRFIIIAKKDNELQLIQNITYTTSEDALYNIMRVCEAYSMPVEETRILASGLINMGSNLYNTLHSYLDNFEIENTGEIMFGTENFAEHPAHYFLPFI